MMPSDDPLNARQIGEDAPTSIMWVQKEIEKIVQRLVQHLEYEITTLQTRTAAEQSPCTILKLSADFILDDKCALRLLQ